MAAKFMVTLKIQIVFLQIQWYYRTTTRNRSSQFCRMFSSNWFQCCWNIWTRSKDCYCKQRKRWQSRNGMCKIVFNHVISVIYSSSKFKIKAILMTVNRNTFQIQILQATNGTLQNRFLKLDIFLIYF